MAEKEVRLLAKNLRVPRITHTELSYDKALLPEARVTGLILNDIRKTRDAGY